MEEDRSQNVPPGRPRTPGPGLLVAGCAAVILIALLIPRGRHQLDTSPAPPLEVKERSTRSEAGRAAAIQHRPDPASAMMPLSAGETVARRAAQFARSRYETLRAMARKRNIAVPPDVERFFEAAQGGNWNEIEPLFNALSAQHKAQPRPPELDQLWSPIFDTFGALAEAHKWPAQQYLDYGNAVLDSLRPGMVYVGGTDPGRFIPELMSETGDGEAHVVITQNGLADPSYWDFLGVLYGDRLSMPSQTEFQNARNDYEADYQQRLAHDRQFPDESKRVLPGENITWDADGSTHINGSVAVMAFNERLLQLILKQNPDAPFALEESFPLKSTYAEATPLGPIMELRAAEGQNALTADTAAQSLNYWQNTAQRLLADPEATAATWTMKTYSKMVDAQANLFAARGLNDQAEQAYRLSLQLYPAMPEGVFGYVQLLMNQQRPQDALTVAQAAARSDPNNKQFQVMADQLQNAVGRAGR